MRKALSDRFASKDLGLLHHYLHIRLRYHMVRDLVEEKIIAVHRIPKELQLADIFTKNVSVQAIREMAVEVMGHSQKGYVICGLESLVWLSMSKYNEYLTILRILRILRNTKNAQNP
jgi:hypothetical protein